MIRWHPLAAKEFKDAIEYLSSQASPTIARDFAASVQQTLQLLERHPAMGSPIAGNAQRLAVRNFTYWLIYRAQDDHLSIVALAHQRRLPGIGRGGAETLQKPSMISGSSPTKDCRRSA